VQGYTEFDFVDNRY